MGAGRPIRLELLKERTHARHSVSSQLVKYNIIGATIFMTFRTQIHTKKFCKNGFRNLQGTMSHRPLTNTSSLKITAAYCRGRLSRTLKIVRNYVKISSGSNVTLPGLPPFSLAGGTIKSKSDEGKSKLRQKLEPTDTTKSSQSLMKYVLFAERDGNERVKTKKEAQ